MKKLTAMLMVLVLLTLPFAGAETATPSLILSSANPLPEIYERVSPSVVSVVLTTTVWDAATDSVKTTEQGGASAVCVNGDGYFLTNYHVVKEADEMEIRLADGTAYEAYTVGFDEATDVAVIRVEEKTDNRPVTIGKSSGLRVGDLICTIGTPVNERGMYNTLTAGYVSGLNREDADPESTRAIGLIQIDAPINPGNSGGALLNAKGELVGIPFMKYMGYAGRTESGEEFVAYDGLAFAIPIDVAWPIAESIIKTGVYNRPRFGVSVQAIDGPEEMLKNFPPAGLQVAEVEKNGSGAKAGLRAGDVITHVNGARIYDFREYTKIIDKLPAGTSFEITVARYNDEKGEKLRKPIEVKLTVTLEMID